MHCMLSAALCMLQVHADFEYIGKAGSLSTVCLYGGSPLRPPGEHPEARLRRSGGDARAGQGPPGEGHTEAAGPHVSTLHCHSF